ncbi:PQQ-dependent sugar dehydrogenase [Deinococcus hopiensis]|uniref:Glucose/arabinose dehydrogenase, beta-propeller fold n=1 Tax=Deinococcus hopiensis KR-140 TaxID=695939 RepID=A0A1W1V6E9_9DEIO|nr:PQQ-dependent sugar dehydrogenase [Deinococcus hopiensis]SMB88893.1 Glucose/arabinose dehydrogenase, beta-propeller fold [Deinococcus hopiensis KR-140]
MLRPVCLTALAALLTVSVHAQSARQINFTTYATALPQVTTITHGGDGSGRLYVTLQGGQVRLLEGGKVRAQPFLDVSRLTSAGGERGLLGLAFDPGYKQNRRLYVHYTDRNGDTVLARYTATADFSRADAGSAKIMFTTKQPYANHNGGQLGFGPDGFLYMALGDGGSGGDPQNNGQNLGTPLGKLLRFDVRGDAARPAPGNPFLNRQGANPNIWAYGLRNPWRFSFDRATGDMIIADVGQNTLEEVNRQPRSSKGGENYGWRVREGDRCFEPAQDCRTAGLVEPVLVYGRSEGQSITGGYVYRGAAIPALKGQYVFADFASGTVWAAPVDTWKAAKIGSVQNPSTFGEGEDGELYVAEYGSGQILKLGP